MCENLFSIPADHAIGSFIVGISQIENNLEPVYLKMLFKFLAVD